jgi:hypothetical protein
MKVHYQRDDAFSIIKQKEKQRNLKEIYLEKNLYKKKKIDEIKNKRSKIYKSETNEDPQKRNYWSYLKITIILIIINILLYILSYRALPYSWKHGCGCFLIPVFFFFLYFFVAVFWFIVAVVYIIKFWNKEKPKYFYLFVILSIFNFILYLILLNGIVTIFPFLGYLGFL